LPDLIQVNFLLPVIDVVFNLLQASPALAAAFAGINGRDRESESIDKNAISFFFIFNSMKPLFDWYLELQF
jgi:hypothetical protein